MLSQFGGIHLYIAMKFKNTESKRTYVPKKIGETLSKVNRVYSSKFGKIEFLIISRWPQIVGSFFADHSEPDRISRIINGENELGDPIYKNFLHVRVSPAAALEFQHYKMTVIEKINSFFGYMAIEDLRLQQNFVSKKINQNIKKINETSVNKEDKEIIKNEISDIQDKELEKSIVNLGASIMKENK